jgi:uncharacterized protein YjbI with pentapeptide repeats
MIGVDLRTARTSGSGYPATSFFRADLRNANLQGVVSTASFWQVDLSGANLQNGLFEYVRYATMSGANLTNASFVRMDFTRFVYMGGDDLSRAAVIAIHMQARVLGICHYNRPIHRR